MKRLLSLFILCIYFSNLFFPFISFSYFSWILKIRNIESSSHSYNPLGTFSIDFDSTNDLWEDLKEVFFKMDFGNNSWFTYNWVDQRTRIWTTVITSPVPSSAYNSSSWLEFEVTNSSNLTITNWTQIRFSRSSNNYNAFTINENISTYQNNVTTYFYWKKVSDSSLVTWNQTNTIIYINVKPHIIDYYFEKWDGSQTTSQIQWSDAEPINLVVKVKDYNWCSNLSSWRVYANLLQLWFSSSEQLSYVSCDSWTKIATFKKSWITTSVSNWTYSFPYSNFSSFDNDSNQNDANDSRFWNPSSLTWQDDKKDSVSLTVVSAAAPSVSLISLSDNYIWWPNNLSSILSFSWSQSWETKISLWSDWSCVWWTTLEDWTSYTWSTIKNYTINSSSLSSWINSIYACVKNSWWNIWSINFSITKDTTSPTTSFLTITPVNIVLNDTSVRFSCSEDWIYEVRIWWTWNYDWTFVWSWSAVANTQYTTTLLNSSFPSYSNYTIYWYCRDNATNTSFWTWTVTKVQPTPAMWNINSFSDNDIDYNWLDWRDLTFSWDNTSAVSASNFESYRIYLLPSNISFGSWSQTYIKLLADKNLNTFTWDVSITKDSLNQDLTSWWSYKICMAIMWTSWQLWTSSCSSPAILTSDVVQNAKILSAKFTSNTNLELTTDTTVHTTLSSHSWALISYTYGWNTYNATWVWSINWAKINLTIQSLNNIWATWTNIIALTWAIRSSAGWYNNYFSSWSLVISDWQAPTVTWFANNTSSVFNGFFSWSINVWFTFAESMMWAWNTRLVFDRTAWNASSQKTFSITDSTKLTSWAKTQDLTLSWLLVSWVTYNMTLVWQDLAGNSVTSSWITIKFDNVWPTKPVLNNAPNTSSTTPTVSWSASSDDSWNWSWVKEYILKLYSNNNCSSTATQTHNVSWTSKALNTLTNWTYSFNVQAVDNMWNLSTISDCDDFVVDTSIATIANFKITDTTLNSTSFTKSWNNLQLTADLTNTNSWRIQANISALSWNASHTWVLCSSPVSWVSCSYTSWVVTYSFLAWFWWTLTQASRQASLYVENNWWTQNATSLASITVDNTNPTTWTISAPTWTIWWNSNNISWSWISDTNLDFIRLEYSSNWWSSYTLIWTWWNSSPYTWNTTSITSWSNYKVRIIAYDRAWNQSTTESSTFAIDKDWPNISTPLFLTPLTWVFVKWNNTYNITWNSGNITDTWWLLASPITLQYSTDATNYNNIVLNIANTWTYTWTIPSINSSTVTLKIIVQDNVWNTSSYTTPYNFIVDSTAPTFSIWVSTPPNGAYINSSWFNIEWLASDTNLKTISYSLKRVSDNYYFNWTTFTWSQVFNILQDNISWISYNINQTVTPTLSNAESYDLVIKTADKAWNEFSTIARRYVWDITNPTLNIATSSWTYFSWSLNISWTSSDSWAWISSVKISIKKWSLYWDWSSFVASATELTTTTSNSYANWSYSFNAPSGDDSWQVYQVIVYAYDSSYKVNNSTNSTINIILDKVWPNILDNVFTFDTNALYTWWSNLNITWNTWNITDTWSSLKSNPIKLEYFNWTSFSLIADNLANNWSYNFTLPQDNISNARIRIYATDNVWNISFKNSNAFLIDSTPPTISSVETMDLDTNGQIDWLLVTMSESIKDSTIVLSNFNIWSWVWVPTWYVTWAWANDNAFTLTFSNTWTTSTTPTLSYTKWSLTDIAWKSLESVTNFSSIDKAVPRITKAEFFDINSNWKLDKVEVTFSENISSTTNTWAFSVLWETILSSSVSNSVASLVIQEWSDYNTSTSWKTLSFTSNSNWKDISNNQAWSLWSAINISDKAKPILITKEFLDSNSDFVWDKVELTFSENLTWTVSWFTSNTWTISSPSLSPSNKVNLVISWVSWTAPNLTLSYNWNLADSSWNLVDTFSNISISEKISPKILTSRNIDQNWNWKVDSILVSFSESLTWSFSDINFSVNSYSLASSSIYSFSWSTWVLINLDEKQTFDTDSWPLVTLNSNTSLKDLNNNIVSSSQSFTSVDGVWPVITWARFDEATRNLYLNFSENVSTSLTNASFTLQNSTSSISSTTFTTWTNSAILQLSNTWVTYWSSSISFVWNTAWDSIWNKQVSTFFTQISASVLINEFMPNWNVKYIELRNISSSSVNVWWWILENAISWTWLVLSSFSIPWNSYYLISTNNTYFSWVTANQTASLNITWNLTLKNWNTIVDQVLYQTWSSNISLERLSSCSSSLSSSCWYMAVSSNWFVNNTYKWTPKTQNIFDNTLPTISSSSPTNDTIFPSVWNISSVFNYTDNVWWVWINTWSVSLKVEKYNWSTWNNDNTILINTWTISTTQSNFNLNWFNYWRYRLVFKVSDLAWNEALVTNVFYVDNFQMTISNNTFNLWVLDPWVTKYSPETTITIKTIWVPFTLNNILTKSNDFPNWTWTGWFGWCIWDSCSTLENFSSKQIANETLDLQSSWSLKTYNYKIKYGWLINSLQQPWIYNFLNENRVILNY